MENAPNEAPTKRHQEACFNAGCHDFSEPTKIRRGAHILYGSAEVVVAICSRCGVTVYAGWTGEEE